MENGQIKEFLREKLNFSNQSIQKLEIFLKILLKYNSKYNLIAKSTEKIAWERHILDSAQILRLFNRDIREISDLGTGAGFPGVIISIYDEKDKFHVKLYEKSSVKRQFLENMNKYSEHIRIAMHSSPQDALGGWPTHYRASKQWRKSVLASPVQVPNKSFNET